ncbi:zinc finger CCCH domain-containing protein 13-like isoform X2 [Dunckerocampus dactyliophorus]|uniref:zinc finger CCCH domain-containing protein 13-like isoform X2 n=1 Tax=Dunckerocampus dactyliophorus TaxID=161453 RepID=UPI00240566FF|nr:zinc finger CCCH domain-containing protein 13-like isoform X2 [Dunckerocampus dactyliophorus]
MCFNKHTKTKSHDVQQLIGLPQLQEDPGAPHVKEEEEELWTAQHGARLLRLEDADLAKLPMTVVSVKIEDLGDEPQAGNLLAPLSDSDETTSHSPESDMELTGDKVEEGRIKEQEGEPSEEDQAAFEGREHIEEARHPLWTQNKTPDVVMNLRKPKWQPSPEVGRDCGKNVPKSKKTQAEIQREYRQRLKADADRYQKQKERDQLRCQLWRLSRSEEQKEHERKLAKERSRKYRQRKKASGSGTSRAATRRPSKSTQGQVQKWREAKRNQRALMSAQERRTVNEKRRQKYAEKKAVKVYKKYSYE